MNDYILHPNNINVPNTDFDKLFGNYTKFIYGLLKKKYYNDTGFFALAPKNVKNFYFTTVKNNLEWYRGMVPGIHEYGIFSCFQGTIACNTVADLISAGDFRIEAENPEHKKYIEDLVNYKKVRKKLKRALPMLMACGFMLAVIDVYNKNNWTINFTNGNRYFVEVDDEGKVMAYRRLIMFRSASVDKTDNGFYLVEDRWLKIINGKERCFHSYKIFEGKSSVESLHTNLSQTSNVPNDILSELQYKLGVYQLNKIYELPFDSHIGAVIIHASKTCNGIEDHPEFSDSLLDSAKQFLLEYDQTFTSKQKDRVMADKGVILPESLMPTDFNIAPGIDGVTRYNQYLDFVSMRKNSLSNVFRQVKTMSPDQQKPFFFQSDYRQNDFNQDLDQIKARIADAIKISSSDFGSHTQLGNGNAAKTNDEITALTGISKTTIEEKRAMISDGMEEIFRVILKYAFKDSEAKCSMVFNTSQSADPKSETDDLLQQVQGGILSKKTAMKRKNPNMSEEEINEELALIMQEQRETQQMQMSSMGGMDDYDIDGTITNDDETDNANDSLVRTPTQEDSNIQRKQGDI